MSKELSTATFDYSALDKDDKGKLLCLAGEIKREKAKHATSGLSIGKSVATAHAILAKDGKDGEFSRWVELECGFGRTSAYNYMWAWQRFGNCSTVEQFDSGALYALASPKAPEKAAKEAEKLADKGHKITLDTAKELLDKFREGESRPKSSPRPAAQTQSQPKPPLPAEGTASQTESGSQGEVGAGEESTGQPSGGTSFNPSEWTPTDLKDSLGNEVPGDLEEVFEITGEFDEQRNKLKAIKSWLTQRIKHPAGKWLDSAVQRIRTDIDHADSEIKHAKPYCPCVYCHNKEPKVANCNACKGLGWITEPIYDAAPKGMKRETVKG